MAERLLAEDAFLVLLGRRGWVRGDYTVDTIGATVLDDLASRGLVQRVERERRRRRPRAVVVPVEGAAPPGDPVLLGALAILGERPWHPEWTMRLLGRQLRWQLGDRLVAAEELEQRRDLTERRWVPYSNARDRVRESLRVALEKDRPPDDERVVRLAVLLHAGGKLGRALGPGLDRRQRRERSERAFGWREPGDWVAEALDHATSF